MVLASSYVIERIYNALEESSNRGQEIFEKFSRLYPEDSTLNTLYDKFKDGLPSNNPEEMEMVKQSLEELKSVRKLITNGATDLWYKSRRP